jgi:uncharacterized repeat protein (TIGR03803 family)
MRHLQSSATIVAASLAFAFSLRPPTPLSQPLPHATRRSAEHVLYAFNGARDGSGPVAGVTAGPNGVLYGTTILGGGSSACSGGCGTVFKLAPTNNGYAESVVYRFNGKDGEEPQGPLLTDKLGAVYGVTLIGGAFGYGTVLKLTPRGSGYGLTVLHSFSGAADGSQPSGGLIADQSGSLYGTTQFYGSSKNGTVFKLTPTKAGYAFSVIYTFKGGNDGAYPLAGLTAGARGALFGTTSGGGTSKRGTAFELTPARTGYVEHVLYSFRGGNNDGSSPAAALFAGAHGSLYGTTLGGGLALCYGYTCGTVFRLTPAGSSYKESLLYMFQGGNDGAEPAAALVGGAGGTLYGTTVRGGGTDRVCPNYPLPSGCGTVFALTPSGSTYAETVLYPFQGGAGGSLPYAGLTADGTGVVYGATYSGGESSCGTGGPCGTIFKITP